MRIGVDIDGVLTDIEQWQIDYGSKFYHEKYNKGILDHNAYETNDMFQVPTTYDDAFWDTHFEFYSKNSPVRSFASEVIDKLRAEQHEIYIITARGSFLSQSSKIMSIQQNQQIVLDWLKKNRINYHKIIFTPENKVPTCRQQQVDIMIEDSPANIQSISKIIPVICYHANYNQKCNGPNIYRCYSWYDIYHKFQNHIFQHSHNHQEK